LDNKVFSELSKNLKEMVKTIFPTVKNKDIIFCKLVNNINHNMTLTVNGVSKNISVKTGNTSLIFKDRMSALIGQLLTLKVSNTTLFSIIRYHKGYVNSDTKFKSFGSMLKEDFKKEIECVKECQRRGIKAPCWSSANTPGGDEKNAAYLAKYSPRIKML
jgi:hypothetical protein